MRRNLRMPKHGLWFVAGGCIISLVILVIALFAIPAAAPPAPVTIHSIDWQIEQNPPVNGTSEFAELWINQSGPIWGYPIDVRAGGTFNDSLVIVNDEYSAVPIYCASISPPLRIVSTFPTLPMVAKEMEDNLLTLTIVVQAGTGAQVSATGVVDTLSAGCTPS
jgi:hypothetical protein